MLRPLKEILVNMRIADSIWGRLSQPARIRLKELIVRYGLSVAVGDLQYLDGRWYVTHAGLLRLAQRKHCAGISVRQERDFCDPGTCRWVFKATVYKRSGSRGFAGYGDADPTNTSPLVRGAEMRVAETRAVNRALRKAYGIGLCSVEELKWLSGSPEPAEKRGQQGPLTGSNDSNNGNPRLRDRLCILIRQYNLDPMLVKAYAADFCGTSTLREANRELVESFITQLAASAQQNREALISKLRSYAQSMEVRS